MRNVKLEKKLWGGKMVNVGGVVNKCCLYNMEYIETPIANELEIWHCDKCTTYWDIPIKITRYWEEIRLRHEDKHTNAIKRALKRLELETGFGVPDGRLNESQIK